MNDLLQPEDRIAYIDAITALNIREIPHMLGGAFAVYNYTNWWRHTHDMDIYITMNWVEDARGALVDAGFRDIGEQADGDSEWILHMTKGGIVVDVIWRFANLMEYITADWLNRAPQGRFAGVETRFIPLEELIWLKLFIINRHRCDWPDIFRVIKAQCHNVDWNRLLAMAGEHWRLLAALIDVFDWLHPNSVECVPNEIRDEFDIRRHSWQTPDAIEDREHLLDPWIHQRTDRYATRRDE